ncbi:MAG: hypothetical protein GX638_14225, partial [Crenarchaeota archaeon]|nr:hypothetical protein [Thermoproteota archaeon]
MRGKYLIFCMFVLFSVCLLVNANYAFAAKAGYTHMVYSQSTAVTFDGKWTTVSEWTDGYQTGISENSFFRDKWLMVSYSPISVTQTFLVEILDDITNDAEDYWQICFDGTMDGGNKPQ